MARAGMPARRAEGMAAGMARECAAGRTGTKSNKHSQRYWPTQQEALRKAKTFSLFRLHTRNSHRMYYGERLRRVRATNASPRAWSHSTLPGWK
jgi:hypothetical protein